MKIFKKNLSSLIFHFSFRRGFTLIELLIVIAILGVLAAGVLVAINPLNQIQKANDARRKSDVRQIANALESFYIFHQQYPCFSGDGLSNCGWAVLNSNHALVNGGELKTMPADPVSGTGCPGYLLAMGNNPSAGSSFTLFVHLENANDPEAVKKKLAPVANLPSGSGSSDGYGTYAIGSGGSCPGSVYNYWINSK